MEHEFKFGRAEMDERNSQCLRGLADIGGYCKDFEENTSDISIGVLYASDFSFEEFRDKYDHLIHTLWQDAYDRGEEIKEAQESGQQNVKPNEEDIEVYYQGKGTRKTNEKLVEDLEDISGEIESVYSKVGVFCDYTRKAMERTRSDRFSSALRENVPQIEQANKLTSEVYQTCKDCSESLLKTNDKLTSSGYTCVGVGFIREVAPSEIKEAMEIIPTGEVFKSIWGELGNMKRSNPDAFK